MIIFSWFFRWVGLSVGTARELSERAEIKSSMKFEMKNRKRNRLKGYDYSRDNLYFVTICVKDRVCCLGSVGTGRDLSESCTSNNAVISIPIVHQTI